MAKRNHTIHGEYNMINIICNLEYFKTVLNIIKETIQFFQDLSDDTEKELTRVNNVGTRFKKKMSILIT